MITVYTKPGCSYCLKAKELLQNNNVPYKEFSVDEPENRKYFIEKFPSVKSLPFVMNGDEVVGGYAELLDLIKP